MSESTTCASLLYVTFHLCYGIVNTMQKRLVCPSLKSTPAVQKHMLNVPTNSVIVTSSVHTSGIPFSQMYLRGFTSKIVEASASRTLLNPHNGYHVIIILVFWSTYMGSHCPDISSHIDAQVDPVHFSIRSNKCLQQSWDNDKRHGLKTNA